MLSNTLPYTGPHNLIDPGAAEVEPLRDFTLRDAIPGKFLDPLAPDLPKLQGVVIAHSLSYPIPGDIAIALIQGSKYIC